MRKVHVSIEACLQHYLRLSSNQFMRGDFILVVCHMMNRILSFNSGIVKAKTASSSKSLAELVLTLSPEEIKKLQSIRR